MSEAESTTELTKLTTSPFTDQVKQINHSQAKGGRTTMTVAARNKQQNESRVTNNNNRNNNNNNVGYRLNDPVLA